MPCESFCQKPSIFWENCIKLTFSGSPQRFYHRFMYIAPSSGRDLMNLDLPFKLILRRFEVVFWYLNWECCTFWKFDGNSFKSTNTILLYGFNSFCVQPWKCCVPHCFRVHAFSMQSLCKSVNVTCPQLFVHSCEWNAQRVNKDYY